MPLAVRVEHLKKYYQVFEKGPGVLASIRSIFKRSYKSVRAVDDISFSISEGELVGFIGPNGAGKTTTLKVLSGLLYPTGGFVQVLGFTPWERRSDFLKQISLVMGQKNQLWWDLPAMETFNLNRAIYEIPQKAFRENLEELVKLLDVGDLLNTPVRKLSLGQRMKMELIASLLPRPNVLFLDEPTIGLDIVAQEKMREFIKEYNKRYDATILLTSHYMGDVAKLASRVIIIDKGKILFDGKLDEIVERYAKEKVIKIILSRDIDIKEIAQIGKIKIFEFPKAIVSVPREAAPVAAAQVLQKFPVVDLTIEETPIEEIIREIFTGGKVKEEEEK